jgi:lipid A 3-O-deacylase
MSRVKQMADRAQIMGVVLLFFYGLGYLWAPVLWYCKQLMSKRSGTYQRKDPKGGITQMKKNRTQVLCALLIGCAVFFFSTAMAETPGYRAFAGYGQGQDHIDIFRLGGQKPFSSQWFESSLGTLSGYFELSLNRWEHSGKKIHGIAFSPVFVYYFNTGSSSVIPYVEAGIGAAYLDDYRIGGRNLSSNLQFEDRISIGAMILRMDIKLGFLHYSNAGLKSPNDGIDIWMGTVAWRF